MRSSKQTLAERLTILHSYYFGELLLLLSSMENRKVAASSLKHPFFNARLRRSLLINQQHNLSFYKVCSLRANNLRDFIHSDFPVAART